MSDCTKCHTPADADVNTLRALGWRVDVWERDVVTVICPTCLLPAPIGSNNTSDGTFPERRSGR